MVNKQKARSKIKQLNLEGDLTSDANKMATEFNKYFCKIGEQLGHLK